MTDDLPERMEREADRHCGRSTTDEAYTTVQMLLLAGAAALREARAEVERRHGIGGELVIARRERDEARAERDALAALLRDARIELGPSDFYDLCARIDAALTKVRA